MSNVVKVNPPKPGTEIVVYEAAKAKSSGAGGGKGGGTGGTITIVSGKNRKRNPQNVVANSPNARSQTRGSVQIPASISPAKVMSSKRLAAFRAAYGTHAAEMQALMASIMLPQEFPLVRSPFSTSRPTASISPFIEASVPWDTVNQATGGKDWVDIKQWLMFLTRDPRCAGVYWDPNPQLAPGDEMWIFSGNSLATAGPKLPEMAPGDWVPVMATVNVGTYQPMQQGGIGATQVAYEDEDGVPLALCTPRQSNLSSTPVGGGGPYTPSPAQLVFAQLASNTWYQFAIRYLWGNVRTDVIVQAQSAAGAPFDLGITLQDGAIGLYGVQYQGTGGTGGSMGALNPITLGEGNVTLDFITGSTAHTGTGKFVQCMAPWLVVVANLADGVRVHGNALLISNIMPGGGKSGQALAYNLPTGNSWMDYIGTTAPGASPPVTDMFGTFASNTDRHQTDFTFGADAWLPFGDQAQWSFRDVFATTSAGTTIFGPAFGGTIRLNRIPVDVINDTLAVVAKTSGAQNLFGPQDCLMTWTTSLEFGSDAPLFQSGFAEIGPIEVLQAMFRMRKAPYLTGNPIHVRDLFSYIKSAARALLPVAAGAATYIGTEGNLAASLAAGQAVGKMLG